MYRHAKEYDKLRCLPGGRLLYLQGGRLQHAQGFKPLEQTKTRYFNLVKESSSTLIEEPNSRGYSWATAVRSETCGRHHLGVKLQ